MNRFLVQVRRRLETDWERFGAEKEIMGAGKTKVVQIGNPMEGIHYIKDEKNIVFISREDWRIFQLLLVLIGSIFKSKYGAR
jgi:hypothetical protein